MTAIEVYNTILVHYSEIALKGGNRDFFEQLLIQSIADHVREFPGLHVRKLYGRITIQGSLYSHSAESLREHLKKIFGVHSFSFAKETAETIEAIETAALEILSNSPKDSEFKIEVKRSDKAFPLNSLEICKRLGQTVCDRLGKRVNVKNPDTTCFIEIIHGKAFVYIEKIHGAGGMPNDTGGSMLGFLSGGIDSPVACFRLMRRGARIIFLHFHSYPQTSKASISKVTELAEILNQYELHAKLYLIPFLEIQKQIFMECKADLRVVLYRRFMMRIANEIAKREGAHAFITGENLGQVASQTIENMRVIEEAAEFPILRPVIGYDKQEIIAEAQKIGTYGVSIRPHEDCCSLFMPDHPATKARQRDVEAAEKKLDIHRLIKEAIENLEIIFIRPMTK